MEEMVVEEGEEEEALGVLRLDEWGGWGKAEARDGGEGAGMDERVLRPWSSDLVWGLL